MCGPGVALHGVALDDPLEGAQLEGPTVAAGHGLDRRGTGRVVEQGELPEAVARPRMCHHALALHGDGAGSTLQEVEGLADVTLLDDPRTGQEAQALEGLEQDLVMG
jgi:hypothetical protein